MAALPILLNQLEASETALASTTTHTRPAKLPVPQPTRSFWINSPGANPLASEGSSVPLTPDADVCIIGSGITGVSAAYHLSRAVRDSAGQDGGTVAAAPMKVVILEARDFCSGATGRNGGHLTPNPFRDFCKVAAQYGTAQAIRWLAVEHHTASEIVKFLDSEGLGDEVDLVAGGHIGMLLTEQEVKIAEDDYNAAKEAGVGLENVEWLSKEHMESHYGTSYPAVRYPGHNLWPLKLVTHLFTRARSMAPGLFALDLHTRTPVTSVLSVHPGAPSSRRWSLATPRGSIACTYVIHATNAYSSYLLPHMAGPSGIIPTRGQVVALRANATLAALSKSGWGANEGFEYWFPRPVGSSAACEGGAVGGSAEHPLIILGGGREASGARFETYEENDGVVNGDVGRALREFLPPLFPSRFEEGREPEMEWTGIMGYTNVGDPFVGPVVDPSRPSAYKGQYISAGYTGHGMTRAFACTEAVAGMVMADMAGDGAAWKLPEWLPEHFLTWNR